MQKTIKLLPWMLEQYVVHAEVVGRSKNWFNCVCTRVGARIIAGDRSYSVMPNLSGVSLVGLSSVH